jgi:hypothetical protein
VHREDSFRQPRLPLGLERSLGFAPPPGGGFAFFVGLSSLLCVHHVAKYLGYQERAIRERLYRLY